MLISPLVFRRGQNIPHELTPMISSPHTHPLLSACFCASECVCGSVHARCCASSAYWKSPIIRCHSDELGRCSPFHPLIVCYLLSGPISSHGICGICCHFFFYRQFNALKALFAVTYSSKSLLQCYNSVLLLPKVIIHQYRSFVEKN